MLNSLIALEASPNCPLVPPKVLSSFWSYKIYNSKRQKLKKDLNNKSSGASETSWTGPFYFEEAISFNQFKIWVREHLGISSSSHIAAKVSISDKRNEIALNSWKKAQIMLLRREQKESPKQGAFGARAGNLVVKWLKPEIR